MPNNLPARTKCRLPGANEGPPRALAPPHGTDIIMNRSPHLIHAELNRGRRAGEYGDATQLIRLPHGLYAAKVNRHRAPAPRWRKPALVGAGVGAATATLATTAWWALTALAAALPGGALGGLCLLGLLLAAGLTVGREQIVEVLVKVRVR